MRRGIPIRRSRAAGWARLCGGLALPVLVLAVVGVRIGIVPQQALQAVLAAGFALSLAALGLAGYALADIWVSGAGGARSAFVAVFYASPALLILALVAAAATAYPRMNDIATNLTDPPLFFADGAPLAVPDTSARQVQRQAYPDVVPHLYPAPIGEVYKAALTIVQDRGWAVSRDVAPPPPPPLPPEPEAATGADADRLDAIVLEGLVTAPQDGAATIEPEEPPAAPKVWRAPVPDNIFGALPAEEAPDEAMIEAFVRTPVFGFVDDVVVRLRTSREGTRVDMRSASRIGEHDLGVNARRIKRFFTDLDTALQSNPSVASR